MDLEQLKTIVESKLSQKMIGYGRNRDVMYCKKLFVKLAYDLDIKNTQAKIGDFLGVTHATVLRHYNTFFEVYDQHKEMHDIIIEEYNLPIIKLNVKKLKNINLLLQKLTDNDLTNIEVIIKSKLNERVNIK